jgi:hypothetical protein
MSALPCPLLHPLICRFLKKNVAAAPARDLTKDAAHVAVAGVKAIRIFALTALPAMASQIALIVARAQNVVPAPHAAMIHCQWWWTKALKPWRQTATRGHRVVARNVPSAHRAAKAVHLQAGAVIVQNVRRAVIVQNALPAAKAVNIRRAQKAALMYPGAVPAMVPVGPAESFRAVRAKAANSPVVRAQKGAAMMPVRALQNHSAATSANHARKVRLQLISNHAPHAVSSQIVRHD